MPIAKALAPVVRFDYGAWQTEGQVRRVGSAQDPFGNVRPVRLFLPGGHLWDHAGLRKLLMALVPLPGDPFRKHRRAEEAAVGARRTKAGIQHKWRPPERFLRNSEKII